MVSFFTPVIRIPLAQIRQNVLYIFAHPGTRYEVAGRWSVISKAFDVTEASEVINSDPDALRIARKDKVDSLYE